MRFNRDWPFNAEHFHELRHEEDRVEKILFLPAWPLEHFGQPAAKRLQLCARIADDQRANSGTAYDEHFMRQCVEDRREIAARDRKPAEHHNDQNNKADGWKHSGGGPPNSPEAGGSSELTAEIWVSLAEQVEQCLAVDAGEQPLRGVKCELVSLDAGDGGRKVGILDTAAFFGDGSG